MAGMNLSNLEKKMNDLFGVKAPKMPEGGKKFFMTYFPVLTLIAAVLSVLGAWGVWSAARSVGGYVNLANELSRTYGTGETISTSNLTLWVWLAAAFMVANAVLYFLAYNPLKAHAKKGWDLLFYASLLHVAYSIVTLFIQGRGFGSFVLGLLFSALGFWILFQVRPGYTKGGAHPSSTDSK